MVVAERLKGSKIFLFPGISNQVDFSTMTTWRGKYHTPGKGHQGQPPLVLYHPAFYCGLYRHKHANTTLGIVPGGCSPTSAPQPPLPSCRLSLRFPLIPAAGGPDSNYFSQGSTITAARLQRGSGGRLSEKRKPPPPRGPLGSGSSPRGEQSREGARSTASGTTCPSARSAAARRRRPG